ncbi:restriction endonuclease subunit S [Streptomyces sp. NPDC052023]|uniref:restriction endonuclease subunit S n=1 Tax=Streptomyces sp. NPDC052023 TaxID=3365681 RepID=UPI0037D7E19C
MSSRMISPLGRALPDGWNLRSIGELCTKIGSGATPKGGAAVYKETGTSFIRSQNVFDHRFSSVGLAHIDDQAAEKLAGVTVYRRDVLLNITGDGETIARCCVVPDWVLPARVNQHVMILRTLSDLVPEYLQRYLSQPAMRLYMLSHNSGGSRRALTKSQVASFQIAVPPVEEQRAISAVLGALDDKIAVNERIAAVADQLAGAYFRGTFPQALNHIEAGTPLSSEWTTLTIGDATTVIETGIRPRGGVAQYGSGVPSIGAESVVGLGWFDFAKTKFIPREFFAAMRRGVLEDRDILVYKDGGKPGEFKPHVTLFGNGFPFSEMCINEHVYRVRMKSEIGQEFGYYWLCSAPIMAEMRRRGTGAAIPGINSTAFKGIPVVVPPQGEVAAFREAAAPLIDRALAAAVESRTLATLRDTLLPQLMSGRLRVKDAEKIVEDAT